MKENSLLKSYRGFFPLVICQFFSCFGDSFLRALFILLITFRIDISGTASAIMVSLAMALFMVPFFFVSSNKSNADYFFDKVLLMRRLQIVQICIAALAIYGFTFGSNLIILASIVFYGVYSVLFSEIRHAIMCSVLRRQPSAMESQKIRLAALFGLVIGIVAAGVVGIYYSEDVIIQSVVLMAGPFISYLSSLLISTKHYEKVKKIQYVIESPLECWRKATKNRNIRHSLQGIAWFWLLGAIFMSQLPALTRDDLHCDASAFIFLLTVFFLGIGVGTSIANSILKKEIGMHFVPTAMLVISIFAFDIANLTINNKFSGYLKDLSYFLSYRDGINLTVDFFFLACAGGIYLMPLYKYLQLSSNKPYRTQIRIANNVMNAIFVGTGSVITIALLSLGVKASVIIVLLACTNFLTAVYICKILPNTVIKNAFRTLFILLYRIEVSGIENLTKAGSKTLIISNHTSFLDPVILSAFIPGRVYFAVGDDIGKARITKLFMKMLNGRTIDYSHPLSAKTIIDKLKSKEQVVMFPEGRISVTGSLMKIYDSPGVIAEKAGASLLPIKIGGTEYSIFSKMSGKLKLKILPKIKMTIFPVRSIFLKQEELSSSREKRHIIGDKLYDIMSESMFTTEYISQTLFEALVSASKKFGSASKVIGDTHKVILTYKKLITASFILGAKISEETKYSERVGILLPNMSGTVAVFFAMIAYGRTPALLNFSTGIKNMLSCCKAATINTVYTSKAFIDVADLHSLVKALEEDGIRIIYMENLRKGISSWDKIAGLLKSYCPLFYHNRYAISKGVSANSPAAVLFTSGSEGAPKGVVLSHKNIISNLQQVVSRIDISSSDRLFNALPMFHSFGLTAGTIMPLLSGVFTFLYPSPLHYRIIPEMIYANNSTIFFGTDTFLSGYAKYAHPYDFFSVRYVCAGAEALRNETRKIWMDKFGIRVLEGYGATEASPVISLNTPLHCKNGTAGRMLPSMSWRIDPVEGIAFGGRLVISGPNVMLGYLKAGNPGVIEPPSYYIDGERFRGWYDTGDIVSIDEENYITIEGRVKRFAKIAGEMVSLPMIEDAINTLWPDERNAAIAISEPKRGEAIMIFTTRKDPSREEIAQFFHASGYAEIFCPKKVAFIDEIPVLGTGKTDYVSLQEIASQI